MFWVIVVVVLIVVGIGVASERSPPRPQVAAASARVIARRATPTGVTPPPQPKRKLFRAGRNKKPYWQESGWKRCAGNAIEGTYRTQFGTFRGRIEGYETRSPNFYIWDPPYFVLEGPHGCCFTERSSGYFEVHIAPRPRSVETGIGSIVACVEQS